MFSPRTHSVTSQTTSRFLHLAYAHTTCHKHYVLKVPHDCNLRVEVTLHLLKHPTLVNTMGDFENSNFKKNKEELNLTNIGIEVVTNLTTFFLFK